MATRTSFAYRAGSAPVSEGPVIGGAGTDVCVGKVNLLASGLAQRYARARARRRRMMIRPILALAFEYG